MAQGRDRAKLEKLLKDRVGGLTPELLWHLPRPLSAPRTLAADGKSVAEIEAEQLERLRKEVEAEQAKETADEKKARSDARQLAESYRISDELLHAVQVALLLRQPLLLTGDPGVGKTRFGRALAGRLEVPYERVDVKTTTSGRDLLYAIDDIARFRDAAARRNGDKEKEKDKAPAPPPKALKDYVVFSGLGRAILRSAGAGCEVRPKIPMAEVAGPDHAGRSKITLGELFPDAFVRVDRATSAPVHSVVLIDELDKAPRDTPNDLLVEVEEMVMYIRELGFEVRANPLFWPIVLITSNSERTLPDPFLRRCVFHNLRLDDTVLPEIIVAQLPDLPLNSPLVTQVIKLFLDIRLKLSLEKKPSTAELVNTVALLVELGFDPAKSFDLAHKDNKDARQQVAAALGKVTGDKSKIADYLAGK
jgi:MoxR-like ATPase